MASCLGQLAGIFYPDFRFSDFADGPREMARGDDGFKETFHAPGLLMRRRGFPPLHGLASPEPGLARSAGDCCAWDGRLDNRAELINLLGEVSPSTTDVELVLAILRRDGEAALLRLVGDWSLAFYDATERAVVLASDYAGIRPLYYLRRPESVLWSSSLDELVRWSNIDIIDEDYVAEFLTYGLVEQRTPYRGIYAVPPGTAVRIAADSTRIHRFWDAPVACVMHYRRESDYQDRLRSLFREAIACRIHTGSAVCAELSGGLDSSAVVCMANRLIHEASAGEHTLTTFTYEDEGTTDKPFYEAVESACATRTVHLKASAFPLASPDCAGKAAPLWWEPRLLEIARRMEALRSSVFLTGQLGDLVMGNWIDDSEQASDLLCAGRLSDAVAEAFAWSRSLQIPVWSILWRAATAAFGVESASGEPASAAVSRGDRLFGDSLAAPLRMRADVAGRRAERRHRWAHVNPSMRKKLRLLDEMLQSRKLECPPPLLHVCYSHPFLHRPLVEFMLTTPAGVTCRPGEPRRLMRRAFADLLPAPILHRRSKGDYGALFASSFRPMASELLRNVSGMQLVERGYVDRDSVKARMERMFQALPCNEAQLRCLILLEFWMRNRDKHASGARYPGLGQARTHPSCR